MLQFLNFHMSVTVELSDPVLFVRFRRIFIEIIEKAKVVFPCIIGLFDWSK